MKKLLFFLLTFAMAVSGVSCAAAPTAKPKNEGAVVQTMDAVASSEEEEVFLIPITTGELWEPAALDPLPPSESNYNDDIPLTCEEQKWLQAACKEFDVPYALALGLIEKETHFRNVTGDDGASAGYMQIQRKWHRDRMERLGVTDLLDPEGNFRVGLDFLSELYRKYHDWTIALTVYNMGHNPGYVTNYANAVMENHARWQELVEPND